MGLVQQVLLLDWRHRVLAPTCWQLRLQEWQGQELRLLLRLLLHKRSTWEVLCRHKQWQEEGLLDWQVWAVLWGEQMQQRQ